MKDFNVILGMDWLVTSRAVMDCFNKTIKLTLQSGTVEFVGQRKPIQTSCIFALKAKRLLKSGCEGYLAFITMDKQSKVVEGIPVVYEFPYVFSDEISSLPLVREIDFSIELVPGTAPISKAPYRMTPVELRVLKTQLEDLLDKMLVRPSVSPLGTPILFVKKKMA